MKLYRKMRKRTAKKQLRRRDWNKLNFAKNLKPGDVISTCAGYNEIIEEIKPEWVHTGRFAQRYIYDFDIITTDGGSCSLIHCCEGYVQSREEIEAYWLEYDNPIYKEWHEQWSKVGLEESFSAKAVRALRAGKEVFLPNGCLNKEWLNEK